MRLSSPAAQQSVTAASEYMILFDPSTLAHPKAFRLLRSLDWCRYVFFFFSTRLSSLYCGHRHFHWRKIEFVLFEREENAHYNWHRSNMYKCHQVDGLRGAKRETGRDTKAFTQTTDNASALTNNGTIVHLLMSKPKKNMNRSTQQHLVTQHRPLHKKLEWN